jgi:hypothetical protein
MASLPARHQLKSNIKFLMGRFNRVRIFGVMLSTVLVVALMLPTIRWLTLQAPDGSLYGYTNDLPPKPQDMVHGFFNRSFQRWAERYFDVNMGFREKLIRTFNEVNFRIFHEAPRIQLYSTPKHGLYSKMSIDNLNWEVVEHDQMEQRYDIEATKLLRLQNLLRDEGKEFQVVIATSKPYVYPHSLGDRYLVGGSKDIFKRAASFGDVLRAKGVNVTDGGPLLREFAARSGIETHPNSGVHWNYYAGCIATRQMFDDIRARKMLNAPSLDCGKPVLAAPHWVDTDGLDLLNIWSHGGLDKPTPFPTITQNVTPQAAMPKLVFVGDSFGDQMRYPLDQARAYSRIVTSGYFRVREVKDPVANISVDPDLTSDPAVIQQAVAEDIAKSDLLVLEMVDYNVVRWGYGLADYLLDYSAKGGSVEVGSVADAYDRETDGVNWWNWIKKDADFQLWPTFVPPSATRATLKFDYVTLSEQTLTVKVETLDGTSQQFVVPSHGGSLETFETKVGLPPSRLSRVTIQTNGKASAIGNGDSRIVTMRIRNLAIKPLLTASAQ